MITINRTRVTGITGMLLGLLIVLAQTFSPGDSETRSVIVQGSDLADAHHQFGIVGGAAAHAGMTRPVRATQQSRVRRMKDLRVVANPTMRHWDSAIVTSWSLKLSRRDRNRVSPTPTPGL